MRLAVTLIWFVLLSMAPLCAEEESRAWAGRKLAPVDEATKDPEFAAFRKRLIEAVEKKDAKHLESVLAPDVMSEVGGEPGAKNFKDVWAYDSPTSEFWRDLRDVLALGGAFGQTEHGTKIFTAPYTTVRFPKDLYEWDIAAVTGEKVNVRKEPNSKAEVVASLSHDIVRADWDQSTVKEKVGGDEYLWVKVELADGRTGYVYGKYLRGPMDVFAQFEKRDGRWYLTSFLAPD